MDAAIYYYYNYQHVDGDVQGGGAELSEGEEGQDHRLLAQAQESLRSRSPTYNVILELKSQ